MSESEREEFIRRSSSEPHPYSWEIPDHPAMMRPSTRRLRHGWTQTRRDWLVASGFLLAILAFGGLVLLLERLRG